MKLKRFLLRYHPPGANDAIYSCLFRVVMLVEMQLGIILEYEKRGETRTKTIDLLDLAETYDCV